MDTLLLYKLENEDLKCGWPAWQRRLCMEWHGGIVREGWVASRRWGIYQPEAGGKWSSSCPT